MMKESEFVSKSPIGLDVILDGTLGSRRVENAFIVGILSDDCYWKLFG